MSLILKSLIMLLLGLGLLTSSVQVSANSATEQPETEVQSPTIIFNPTRNQERVELRRNRIEARITTSQQRQEERVENRQERRADFAQNHANRIERRFNLYVDHLLNLASRIETRAQTMSKNGKNVSEALAKITEARTYIASAQIKGANAVSQFRSINPATYETQREIALSARDLAEAAREDFKTARELLREAVQILVQTQNQE